MEKHLLFYVHNYPGFGGIEKVTTILANYFACSKNWKISIISFAQNNVDKLLEDLDNRVNFLEMPNSLEFNANENRSYLLRFLTENEIFAIIFQDSYADIHNLLIEINKSFNIPIITVEHNDPFNQLKTLIDFQNRRLYFRSARETIVKLLFPYIKYKAFIRESSRRRFLYNNSKYYILLSDKYFSEFIEVSKIKKTNKLVAINNPITITAKPADVDTKKKQLLFVGRMALVKNVRLLIKIWQNLYKDFPEWEFVLVGNGEERSFLESYVKDNNIPRVCIVDFTNNVVPYYKEASIFCMASLHEGFPLTLVEAMSMGVIPVAFNTFSSITDIIKDGENGFLINPWDTDKYIECLRNLMNNDVYRKKIAVKAQGNADKFALSTIAQKWFDLIERIN